MPELAGAKVARLGAEGVVGAGVAGRVAGLLDTPGRLAPLRAVREAFRARSELREQVGGGRQLGDAARAGGALFEFGFDRREPSSRGLGLAGRVFGELRLAFAQVGDAAGRLPSAASIRTPRSTTRRVSTCRRWKRFCSTSPSRRRSPTSPG